MADQKISDFRREYLNGELLEKDLLGDPYQQFMDWLEDAIRSGITDPTAMALATASSEGRPSLRIVLLKDASPDGLVFFTHYNSRKGEELEANPYAAVTFFWPCLDRQIRVEGRISKTSAEEANDFFNSRPLESRISSIVSPQSNEIPDREYLDEKFTELKSGDKTAIKRPDNWGGYILKPDSYEFWQGRENRLNDRLVYALVGGVWKIKRLAP
jgi:pyridoxamine 5'-phosphate oxidase